MVWEFCCDFYYVKCILFEFDQVSTCEVDVLRCTIFYEKVASEVSREPFCKYVRLMTRAGSSGSYELSFTSVVLSVITLINADVSRHLRPGNVSRTPRIALGMRLSRNFVNMYTRNL